jgi:SAM-dependent methyltransferase
MSDPRAELSQRIMGFIVSAAIYVAAKLDVARIIGARTLPIDELSRVTGCDADALYRTLRLLAAHGIFVETDEGSFANTESSALLADRFRDFALVFGEEFYPAFNVLLGTLRDGTPAFEAVAGKTYYEHLASDRDASARFNRFMATGKESHAAYLAASPFLGDGQTVVDVGGGNGALVIALLERRRDLRGVVFDLAHVTREAEERVREAGLADRCRVVPGDFFEAVPNGDSHVLSGILHGWQRDGAERILRNVRHAIANDGRLFLLESVVAPGNEPGGKLMDVLMLAVSGGRERTEAEWHALLAAGGFELAAISAGPPTVLEAVPA